MGLIQSKITQFALDTLWGFVSGNDGDPMGDTAAEGQATHRDPPLSAEAKALAQSPQAPLARSAQLFADEAPSTQKSPYPAGSAEALVEFLNGDGQSLDPLTRTVGYLEAARRESDVDVKAAYLDSAYQEAWHDLSGQERTLVRQAHAQILLAAKSENDKNDWYDMPGSEANPVASGMKRQWLQGRKDSDRKLKEAAFKLAQDWQHSLASGTEVSEGEAAVRVMALTELSAFGVAFGEGIDPRDGLSKKLIALGKDQGVSPRQMLEGEIGKYGKDGTPQQKLEQYELAAMAAGRMLDVQWGAGAISILETVRGFDPSGLTGTDAAEARQVRLGVYQLYKQAQVGLSQELEGYPQDPVKLSLEELDNLLLFDKGNAQLQDIRSLKVAMEMAAARAQGTTAALESEASGDFLKVARALHKMEQGQVEDGAKILQSLMKSGSIQDPQAAALLQGLSGVVPGVIENTMGRQAAVVKLFAEAKEKDFSGELEAVLAYASSLPVAERPTNLNDALSLYVKKAENPRNLTELKSFLFENRLDALVGRFSNVDSEADVKAALEQLELVLEQDCHYFAGDGDLGPAIYQAASDLLNRVPRGSLTAKKVARFRYEIAGEEMKRHTYTEWALLIATMPLTFGTAAVAGAAGRFVGTRVAAQFAVRTSTGLTTAELAEMGVATWSRAAVYGEAANWAANATTFWGLNTASNALLFPENPHHSLQATAMDVGFAHYLMRAMRIRGVGNSPMFRALAGALAMSASGTVRVGIDQINPDLDMAVEGEKPWEFESAFHTFVAAAGMEAGGAIGAKFAPKGKAPALPKSVEGEVKVLEPAATSKKLSDAELNQAHKEVRRQLLDVINDELATVGFGFLSETGQLNKNAGVFIDLLKLHLDPTSLFSFGQFLSTWRSGGGHAATVYAGKVKAPVWVTPKGEVRARGAKGLPLEIAANRGEYPTRKAALKRTGVEELENLPDFSEFVEELPEALRPTSKFDQQKTVEVDAGDTVREKTSATAEGMVMPELEEVMTPLQERSALERGLQPTPQKDPSKRPQNSGLLISEEGASIEYISFGFAEGTEALLQGGARVRINYTEGGQYYFRPYEGSVTVHRQVRGEKTVLRATKKRGIFLKSGDQVQSGDRRYTWQAPDWSTDTVLPPGSWNRAIFQTRSYFSYYRNPQTIATLKAYSAERGSEVESLISLLLKLKRSYKDYETLENRLEKLEAKGDDLGGQQELAKVRSEIDGAFESWQRAIQELLGNRLHLELQGHGYGVEKAMQGIYPLSKMLFEFQLEQLNQWRAGGEKPGERPLFKFDEVPTRPEDHRDAGGRISDVDKVKVWERLAMEVEVKDHGELRALLLKIQETAGLHLQKEGFQYDSKAGEANFEVGIEGHGPVKVTVRHAPKSQKQAGLSPVRPVFIAEENVTRSREGRYFKNKPSVDYGPYAGHTEATPYYKVENGIAINEDGLAQFQIKRADGRMETITMVADGMGGQGSGDKASAIALEKFMEVVQGGGSMEAGFEAAATEVKEFNKKTEGRSGAVAVAHRLIPQAHGRFQLEIVHAGDARAVVFVPDGKGGYREYFRTYDHSIGGQLHARGDRGSLEVRIDPKANYVASGLGAGIQNPQIDRTVIDLPEGAVVVSGSDGLWDSVSTREVAQALAEGKTPQQALERLNAILDEKNLRLDRMFNVLQHAPEAARVIQPMRWNDLERRYQPGSVKDPETGEKVPEMVRAVELDDFPGHFIAEDGVVYVKDAATQAWMPVDYYKFDNRTIHIYQHQLVG